MRILLLSVAGAVAIFASIATSFGSLACGPPPPKPEEEKKDGEGEPADDFKYCQTECSSDDDCDGGLYCDESAGTCGQLPCESDTSCNLENNGWDFSPCETSAECFDGYVCVDYGDRGGCAQGTVDDACDFAEVIAVTERGTGDDATVCGSAFVCKSNGSCDFAGEPDDEGCDNDDDCAGFPVGYQSCISGVCGCADDSECTGGFTKCGSDHYCGCAGDSECTSPAYDTCVDGGCECSADSCGEGFTCDTAPGNVDDD